MQFDSSFSMNKVILITSDKSNDGGNTRRLHEDLNLLSVVENFIYCHREIKSKADLIDYLSAVDNEVQNYGIKPILHFHMHGCKNRGLEIGETGEFISWEELTSLLRKINISLNNNLCVISTACYGFHLIKSIDITKATPYFCLVAAQDAVSFGDIDDNASTFYKAIFEKKSINEAYEQVSTIFKYFQSEKLLIVTLGKYILQACKGSSKNKRKEALITQAIDGGITPTSDNLKRLREIVKDHIEPKQDLLNEYIQVFLIGKVINVTMDDILTLVESSSTSQIVAKALAKV